MRLELRLPSYCLGHPPSQHHLHSTTKEKSRKRLSLLWNTKEGVPTRWVFQASLLPDLLAKGSPLFGRRTDDPRKRTGGRDPSSRALKPSPAETTQIPRPKEDPSLLNLHEKDQHAPYNVNLSQSAGPDQRSPRKEQHQAISQGYCKVRDDQLTRGCWLFHHWRDRSQHLDSLCAQLTRLYPFHIAHQKISWYFGPSPIGCYPWEEK